MGFPKDINATRETESMKLGRVVREVCAFHKLWVGSTRRLGVSLEGHVRTSKPRAGPSIKDRRGASVDAVDARVRRREGTMIGE